MFGERYFATHQRLTEVVVGVRELGEACGADVAVLADKGEFLKGLRNPHLFVVCGEVNAGKSTLLNGLFGRELCEMNVLPETEQVHWYRWGETKKDVAVTETLQERYRPIEFLKKFNLVDTPGTNSVVKDHQGITERFLPVADILLFVFSVSNPWGAATWDLISKLSKDQLGNVAFVLQQKDLCDEADVSMLVEHLQALAVQKIGVSPPIFAVSGRAALMAKMRQPVSHQFIKESGYLALESFISRRVSENSARRKILSDVRDSTQSLLRQIEEKIEERAERLDADQRFLGELEREVDHRLETQSAAVAHKFTGLTDVFLNEARDAVNSLRRKMTITQSFVSLFKEEKLASELESELSEAVEEAMEARAEIDGQQLVKDCRAHWETVAPRIKDRLDVPLPSFDEETSSLSNTRERFVQRLGRSSKQAVTNLKLRGSLDLQMENRRSILRRYLSGALCFLTASGVLGALDFHLWPFITLFVTLTFLGTAAIYAHRSKRVLCGNFAEKIESCRELFVDALGDEYKDGVREFYLEYGGLFENVRRYIAEYKLSLRPRLERWNDLFLELKAVEQEI